MTATVEAKSTTIMRAVMLPMAEPVDMTWDDFWEKMNAAWRVSTQLANAMLSALYQADMANKTKLDEIPKLKNLVRNVAYCEYKKFRPSLSADIGSGTASCLSQMAWKRYIKKDCTNRSARWNALTGMATVPTFRYACPFPVHAKDWSVEDKDGQIFVTFKLIGLERITVRLKTGGDQARHEAGFRRIFAEDVKRRELKIIYKKGRTPMIATAVDVPIVMRERLGEVMTRTDSASLMIVTHGQQIWKYHADHVRRMVAEHSRRLQRMSDDSKFETRQIREEIHKRRESECDRHTRKMNSALHKAAAWLVGYADRRGLASLRYDDTDRSYLDKFPWAQLRLLIEQKCEACGIEFHAITAK